MALQRTRAVAACTWQLQLLRLRGAWFVTLCIKRLILSDQQHIGTLAADSQLLLDQTIQAGLERS